MCVGWGWGGGVWGRGGERYIKRDRERRTERGGETERDRDRERQRQRDA